MARRRRRRKRGRSRTGLSLNLATIVTGLYAGMKIAPSAMSALASGSIGQVPNALLSDAQSLDAKKFFEGVTPLIVKKVARGITGPVKIVKLGRFGLYAI